MFVLLGQLVRRAWPLLLAGWTLLLLAGWLTAPPWDEVAQDKEFGFLPPDAPSPNHGRWSRATTTGHILVSARLPGAIEFGRPGRGSNHITPLFIRIPVPGST